MLVSYWKTLQVWSDVVNNAIEGAQDAVERVAIDLANSTDLLAVRIIYIANTIFENDAFVFLCSFS